MIRFKYLQNKSNTLYGEKLLKFNTLLLTQRIYPKTELTRQRNVDFNGNEVSEPYNEIDRLNKCSRLYGQINFGSEMSTPISGTHYTYNLRIIDNWLIGDIIILDEFLYKNIENYIFRSRARGSVNENQVVDLDYIITFDAIEKSDDTIV